MKQLQEELKTFEKKKRELLVSSRGKRVDIPQALKDAKEIQE